jgi:hypothetical protein
MAKYTSGLAYYRDMQERLKQLPKNVAAASEHAVRQSYGDIRELSSGTVKQKQLNREGNPFGRGFSGPKGKRRGRRAFLPLNRQSGRLHSAAYFERRVIRGKTFYTIGFRLPSSDPRRFVLGREGTTKMVARGFWPEVEKRLKARQKAIVDAFHKSVRS